LDEKLREIRNIHLLTLRQGEEKREELPSFPTKTKKKSPMLLNLSNKEREGN